jgi:hypothetical protein
LRREEKWRCGQRGEISLESCKRLCRN